MEVSHGRSDLVHRHMSLQVALRGEGASADAALEGSLARVGAVVHLESTLAGEDAIADDALIGIADLLVLHELFELHCLRGVRHLDEVLPRVVIAVWAWQKGGHLMLDRIEEGRSRNVGVGMPMSSWRPYGRVVLRR